MGTEGSPHWSKDFVEHLRSVHFALIAVSAGLVLLIVSSNIYKPGEALSELESILDLRNRWNFEETIIIHSKGAYDEDSYASEEKKPIEFLCTVYDQVQGASANPKSIRKGSPFVCRIQKKWTTTQSDEFLTDYIAQPSDDIRGFRGWLQKHQVPREFAYLHVIFLLNGVGTSEGAQTDEFVNGTAPPLRKVTAQYYGFVDKQKPDRVVDLSLSKDISKNPEHKVEWSVQGLDRPDTTVVMFGVEVRTFTLSRNAFVEVPADCDRFENCFPELAKASQGLESVTLEQLHAHLAQQLEKGSDVFEAIGLKIPLEELVFWGMVVILSIQLYFLLHLKELTSKIEPTDSGWDVAWIGVFSSRWSRIVFFLTIYALPLIAAGLLLLHAILPVVSAPGTIWQWAKLQSLLEIVCCVLGFIFCALLAKLTWQHRPLIANRK